jgi:hypothetical protein
MGLKLDLSHTKGRTKIEGVSEQGAKENTGPKKEEVLGKAGEDCIMRSFITCTLHQILLG